MTTYSAVTPAAPGFAQLRAECLAEGHRMLERFEMHWRDGSNRFDRPGETAVGAFVEDRLVGLCGRNHDPFDHNPRAGRIRHLYVASAHRQAGIGRTLVQKMTDDAVEWFDYLNTNCPPEAAPFYEHMGFVPVVEERITHRLPLLG